MSPFLKDNPDASYEKDPKKGSNYFGFVFARVEIVTRIEPECMAQLAQLICDSADYLFPVRSLVNQVFEVNTLLVFKEKPLTGAVFHGMCFCRFRQFVPDPDEVRTKLLKLSLESIWKKLDPHSPVFKRFPFDRNQPVVPGRKRGAKGRFSPIR